MSVPKILYHYCSLNTFNSIISTTPSIWLSDISKSSDSAELMYLKTHCRIHLLDAENRLYQMGLDDKHHNLLEMVDLSKLNEMFCDINSFAEKTSHTNLVNSWVVCLSELSDSLGQWRGYGDDGKGVAIGFNRAYLRHISELNNGFKYEAFCLSKVIYSKKELDSFFNNNCGLDSIDKCETTAQVEELFTQCIVKTIDAAYCYKAPSFSEEKEWRIVFKYPLFAYKKDKFSDCVPNKWFGVPNFDYAVMNNRLVSHLELPIVNARKAINRIVLGPKSSLSINDIKYYLIDKGLLNDENDQSIEIVYSNSTYR